jgi:hypothetical protein
MRAMSCSRIAIALLLLTLIDAVSAPQTETKREATLTRDMTEAEVDAAIRQAMPYPVVSILFGVKEDLRHFAVNMRISGKSQPVFNVSWHVPISADRDLMLRSIAAASTYARAAAERIK